MADKVTIGRLIEALTDESKVLNFPVKYPAIELDKNTRDTLVLTASIFAAGMVAAALIKTYAKQ